MVHFHCVYLTYAVHAFYAASDDEVVELKQKIEALQTKKNSLESEHKDCKDAEATLKSNMEESKRTVAALKTELAESKEQAKALQALAQRKAYTLPEQIILIFFKSAAGVQ